MQLQLISISCNSDDRSRHIYRYAQRYLHSHLLHSVAASKIIAANYKK